ncbi:MAG: DJ-1/PfpI family protein [Nitrospirae bacterium]|nr:DJ-1/PfpI family protein [Nitrospirota bacterium]
MARVLVPLASGFEEIEAVTIIDILRRANVEVTVAGTIDGPIIGSRRVPLIPDTTLDAVADDPFDMVVLPGGGEGTANLRRDPRITSLVKRQADRGGYLAAICAAPIVLADAGLLTHKRVTSYPSYRSQITTGEYLTDRVVVDGRLVTSRSPGTALEFALTLVELLVGSDESRRIARDVLAQGTVDAA